MNLLELAFILLILLLLVLAVISAIMVNQTDQARMERLNERLAEIKGEAHVTSTGEIPLVMNKRKVKARHASKR
jgi:preprotein translocase subunit YajC